MRFFQTLMIVVISGTLLVCEKIPKSGSGGAQSTGKPVPTQWKEAKVFKIGDIPVTELVPGADSQLFSSDNVQVSWLFMHPNMEFPMHNHPEEQIMIVREGSILQKLGDTEVELKAGDVAIMPSGLMHGGKVGPEGCKVIDIFYPVRKDYLDKVREQHGEVRF